MHNKTYKNKIKTLCTIETSDIDLQEGKSKTHTLLPASKKSHQHYNHATISGNTAVSKDKIVDSPCLRKSGAKGAGTPVRHGNKYFRNTFNGRNVLAGSPTKTQSQSKNKSKSLLNHTFSK